MLHLNIDRFMLIKSLLSTSVSMIHLHICSTYDSKIQIRNKHTWYKFHYIYLKHGHWYFPVPLYNAVPTLSIPMKGYYMILQAREIYVCVDDQMPNGPKGWNVRKQS